MKKKKNLHKFSSNRFIDFIKKKGKMFSKVNKEEKKRCCYCFIATFTFKWSTLLYLHFESNNKKKNNIKTPVSTHLLTCLTKKKCIITLNICLIDNLLMQIKVKKFLRQKYCS